jgi:uncharacterized protein (DUF1697 family)
MKYLGQYKVFRTNQALNDLIKMMKKIKVKGEIIYCGDLLLIKQEDKNGKKRG